MSVLELKSTTPTARKQHTCSLCTGTIPPGATYSRATLISDGHLYDWLACQPCTDDRVLSLAYDWTGFPDEGVTADTAHEWATEAVIHASPDEQRAAKNYLERSDNR